MKLRSAVSSTRPIAAAGTRAKAFCVAVGMLLSASLMGTTAHAVPIAPPGTKGRLVIVTSTDPVVLTYQGSTAVGTNQLYLMLDAAGNPGDDGNLTNDRFLFTNLERVGWRHRDARERLSLLWEVE